MLKKLMAAILASWVMFGTAAALMDYRKASRNIRRNPDRCGNGMGGRE